VIWVNPSGTESVEAFAERIRSQVEVTLLGLRVWGLAPGERYDMGVEVAAVAEAAGSGPVHLAGFSAGATVALAVALALGDAVRSVVLLEPAFIGDDTGIRPRRRGGRVSGRSSRARRLSASLRSGSC
jgi:pimeloyl-ACP methyl ester carboxylesterase